MQYMHTVQLFDIPYSTFFIDSIEKEAYRQPTKVSYEFNKIIKPKVRKNRISKTMFVDCNDYHYRNRNGCNQ